MRLRKWGTFPSVWFECLSIEYAALVFIMLSSWASIQNRRFNKPYPIEWSSFFFTLLSCFFIIIVGWENDRSINSDLTDNSEISPKYYNRLTHLRLRKWGTFPSVWFDCLSIEYAALVFIMLSSWASIQNRRFNKPYPIEWSSFFFTLLVLFLYNYSWLWKW